MKARSLLQIFLAFLVMFGILPYIAVQLNNYFSLPVYDYSYLKIIGLVFMIIGLSIVIHCAYTLFFRPHQEIPFLLGDQKKFILSQAPEKFTVAGLYKFVRNPMYLGDFIIILSEFFIFGHLLILAYLLSAIFGVNFAVIHYEEKGLKEKFGKRYDEYMRKVPRWTPRFRTEN